MGEFFKKQGEYFDCFLSEKLDEKYGEGTGVELYQTMTNLSFWSENLLGEVTQEKLDETRKEIMEKNEVIKQQLEENPGLTDFYNKVLTINNNYYEMLNAVESKVSDQFVEGETDFRELTMFQRNIELHKLEKLTLKCINQDINNISSKNEALDYIQKWDYYRNRCAISKNTCMSHKYIIGEEATLDEKNFEELIDVQHNLYEKCMEYGVLNIQDEQLFNKLIEAQLYDLSNTSISYEQKGCLDRKLFISDQYLTNEISVKEKKDGNRELSIDKLYRSKGMEGTKALAQREKKTLKDIISQTKEEITGIDK
ncbi:MAG: hypothetical protein HFJ34_05725 [Clostridia bacterium]|nr:hypothetical protein [Clostridia bacterium]